MNHNKNKLIIPSISHPSSPTPNPFLQKSIARPINLHHTPHHPTSVSYPHTQQTNSSKYLVLQLPDELLVARQHVRAVLDETAEGPEA